MLVIREDYVKQNGTVLVESLKKLGKEGERFVLDYEDYIALKNTHWYTHPKLGLIRQRNRKNILLHRYLLEQRGFLPPQKCYVLFLDENPYNLSKQNLLVSITGDDAKEITNRLGGSDFKAPRGVVYDEALEGFGRFQVYVPVFDLESTFLKGTFDNIDEAILCYRNNIMKMYPDYAQSLL